MGGVIASVGSTIIKTLLTEKVMIRILIKLGDYLVSSSKNKLDDQVWAEVKKVLAK